MRSIIIIAAAFSCACLPGEPVRDLIQIEPAFPVSNQNGKSGRLDRALSDVSILAPAFEQTFRLASADPNAIVIEPKRRPADALARTNVMFEQASEPEATGSLSAVPDERAAPPMLVDRMIDDMVILSRIPADPDLAPPISKDKLCGTLADAAQDHDIPVVFFNNLIWQESRFRTRAVSPVGAQGVAQFMPYTAADVGLSNPFDAFQALPASARLLKTLREQFGNLGLAAAAYNVGPKRVVNWLMNKRVGLPTETRNYVQIITGRPADHWRDRARTAVFRLPEKAPCREMPTFAQADEDARQQEIVIKAAEAEKARAEKEAKLAKKKAPPAKDPARIQIASKDDATAKPAAPAVNAATAPAKPASKPLQILAKPVKLAASKIATLKRPTVQKVRTAELTYKRKR